MPSRKIHLSIATTAILALGSPRCPAQVDFNREIAPLFERKCVKCHGPQKSKSGLRLDTRAGALKGGTDGVVIIPGNSADSILVQVVEDQDMPPAGEGTPLTGNEIALLRNWINQGARAGGAAVKPDETTKKSTPAPVRPVAPGSPVAQHPEPGSPVGKPLGLTLPPPSGLPVDFTRDIQPLLERRCLKCHGPERPKSGFRLDNRESALKGGSGGVAIIPGNSAGSPLIHFVAREVEEMEMPPIGKGDPLTGREVALLRDWIDQGARWGSAAAPSTLAFSISPTLRWYSVSGNEQKFREQAWLREGWSGGIGRFTLEQWVDLDTRLTAEGSLDAPGDFDLTLSLRRQGVGFVRGGVEQFRSYDNNYGGYYEPFPVSAFKLDQDLHLDTGRVWAEIGLTRPDWPEITLGYEYRYREGTKSTLHWGRSTQGGETRNLFPASKRIQEDIHIFRGDVRYDWDGLEMENNFMAEYLNLETRRYEASRANFGPAPATFNLIEESHDATQLTNTFSLQKEITDWWLLSGGYYYSHLDGDAGFQQRTVNGLGALVNGQHWASQPIVLDWQTHMFNLSTRLGPGEGLTVSAGLQNNWERQRAIGTANLFFGLPDPMIPVPDFFISTARTSKQSITTTEHVAVRYDRIPRTVVFAEAEWQQESTDYFESDPGALRGFSRDTESRSRDQDYRAGVTVTPWPLVSWNSHYRYRRKDNQYDHERDEDSGGAPNFGYSAFIRGRDIETSEFRSRLNLRPRPWMRTMLTYELQSTDYHTDTDPVPFGLPSDPPGGELLAGEYDSSIYSLDVVLTPWQRLSLNGTFSYQDTRTRSADNDDPAVDDYEGDIYSVLLGATYMADQKTSFGAHYSYSRGDFSQDNRADGFPLGIEYELHGLQAGVSTQLGEHLRVDLQYLFQHHDEPSSGGVNDYTAHGVFANCTLRW